MSSLYGLGTKNGCVWIPLLICTKRKNQTHAVVQCSIPWISILITFVFIQNKFIYSLNKFIFRIKIYRTNRRFSASISAQSSNDVYSPDGRKGMNYIPKCWFDSLPFNYLLQMHWGKPSGTHFSHLSMDVFFLRKSRSHSLPLGQYTRENNNTIL